MRNYIPSKASLFLAELIISILFFTIASVFCVQLFSKAHILTLKTKNLNEAVNLSRNVAEAADSCKGSLSATASCFPLARIKENKLSLYYDDNWQNTSAQKGRYLLDLTIDTNSTPYSVTVTTVDIKDPDTPIYTLNAAISAP